MSLDSMVLLGHSFGAYVCAIYAIHYYERVSNLILLDPWGVLPAEEVDTSSQGLLYEVARSFCATFKVNPVKPLPHLGPLIGMFNHEVQLLVSVLEDINGMSDCLEDGLLGFSYDSL